MDIEVFNAAAKPNGDARRDNYQPAALNRLLLSISLASLSGKLILTDPTAILGYSCRQGSVSQGLQGSAEALGTEGARPRRYSFDGSPRPS
jgi:hypothetical protein